MLILEYFKNNSKWTLVKHLIHPMPLLFLQVKTQKSYFLHSCVRFKTKVQNFATFLEVVWFSRIFPLNLIGGPR